MTEDDSGDNEESVPTANENTWVFLYNYYIIYFLNKLFKYVQYFTYYSHRQILQVGRNSYGRSIITPVNIPVDMMQKEAPSNEDRPHCK